MTQEIESVKPALTVILDDGDFIINSTGAIGKAMSQAVLPLAASAKKVTIIADGEMKVMKRNATAENSATPVPPTRRPASPIPPAPAAAAGLDIQDQFAADLEAGVTGEQAMGETPVPTPGPSDPVAIPAGKRRRPQIFQDAAAPPAPELAEAEMDRLLQEAQQAEQDAAKVQEDRRFQAQQAVPGSMPSSNRRSGAAAGAGAPNRVSQCAASSCPAPSWWSTSSITPASASCCSRPWRARTTRSCSRSSC